MQHARNDEKNETPEKEWSKLIIRRYCHCHV